MTETAQSETGASINNGVSSAMDSTTPADTTVVATTVDTTVAAATEEFKAAASTSAAGASQPAVSQTPPTRSIFSIKSK